MSKFYITNAIPYVNAGPHIGHTLEFIQSDVLARWHRLLGDDTFFMLGTDEHGLKVARTAKEQGVTPQELAAKNTPLFEELLQELQISNDGFIRTSDQQAHWPGVEQLWQQLQAAGYLYKATYKGLYCVGCELYYTEKELADGKCPVHGTKPEQSEEENYFFKLSAFGDQLVQLIEGDELRVVPEARQHEVVNFIKAGLEDVSFSRSADSLAVGVPVPGDATQVMYVWSDALPNYLTGIGYGRDEATFATWWPADVHVIGKDITRFHAVFWPAMLLAAKLPLPKTIYAHGFITSEGQKMSKTTGNVVDPLAELAKHGADALRYYLLSIMPLSGDGDFSQQRFESVYTAELANDVGNLFSRVTAMIVKAYNGQVPVGEADRELAGHIGQTWQRVRVLLDEFRFAEALEAIRAVVVLANKFVDAQQPFKQTGQDQANTLYTLAQVLGHLSLLYAPFLPHTATQMQQRLGITPSTDWSALHRWEQVPAGQAITKGDPLFPK